MTRPKLPEPYSVAAPRDASWYDRPNVHSVKLLHVWGQDMMSACGRSIMSDNPGAMWKLEDVPLGLRCGRPGCSGRWPKAEVFPPAGEVLP